MVSGMFLYSSLPLSSSLDRLEKKEATGCPTTKRGPMDTVQSGRNTYTKKSVLSATAPPVVPSEPVMMPRRNRLRAQRRDVEKTCGIPISQGGAACLHDASSIPPSVVALLAIANLGNEASPQANRRALHRLKERHGKGTDNMERTISATSPGSWSILLSSPYELEQDNVSVVGDTASDLASPIGSFSSESLPSLDEDTGSASSISLPSLPEMPVRKPNCGGRRPKALSSVAYKDCVLDHPLLPTSPLPNPGIVMGMDDRTSVEPETSPQVRVTSSLKSNLTASLRMLKTAAVSFSNFTSPVIQRNQYLARSLLAISLEVAEERRPLPSVDVPDPALRRYLNPAAVSPMDLHFQDPRPPQSICKGSVQLQTIRKGEPITRKATAPPSTAFPEVRPRLLSSRQREPRVNSDFLRVIVLEMNMRRAGKLGDDTPGRAKLWLPARSVTNQCESAVPRRWIGETL